MNKLLSAFCLFLVLSCGCQTSVSEEAAPTTKTLINGSLGHQLDSLLTPYVEELRSLTNNAAGLAIGVTQGPSIVYARTFGLANLEDGREADFNTLFHIASVSKPFAAAAVVKLAEQGRVALDDPIVQHLPAFQMQGAGHQDVTIRHILTHTSGIPRHTSQGDWENPVFGAAALQKNVADAAGFSLDFAPGTEFNYSNSAFDLLANLVTEVSGMPFAEFVTEQILLPAGMATSQYAKPKDSLPPTWAAPYSFGLATQEWSPYPYSENYFPSSGLQTTLPDMCAWGILHVYGGQRGATEVFSPASFAQLTTPQFPTPWGDQIGLGWFLQSYLDRPIIMHTGSDTGFEAIQYIYPADSISIVVMANRDFSRTGRIINAASEAVFHQELKEYQVAAKYRFADAFNSKGLEAAVARWDSLKVDTTDNYYVDDEAILTTGAVLENGQQWLEAREILTHYLTLDDESTYAWRLLGNAHLHLGDTLSAKRCYEQTLVLNPNYEKGKAALEQLSEN